MRFMFVLSDLLEFFIIYHFKGGLRKSTKRQVID